MSTRVIALTGAKRAGKDTVASYLVKEYGFTRVAFADPLREHIYTLNPIIHITYDIQTGVQGPIRLAEYVDLNGWDKAKELPEVRRLLQVYGTEVVRDQIDPDLWINLAMAKIRKINGPVVVTDMRFKNELSALVARVHARTARVVRKAAEHADAHRSEHELAGVKLDYDIDNNSTISDLEIQVEVMLGRFTK